MPQFRDYPPALTVNPSDAILLDQLQGGTVWATLEQLQAFLEGGGAVTGHGVFALNLQWPTPIPDEQTLFTYTATSGFTLFANLMSGSAAFTAGAAGTSVLNLQKNGAAFGTITFDPTEAGQVAEGVGFWSATRFLAGDVLTIASDRGLGSTLLDLLIVGILT